MSARVLNVDRGNMSADDEAFFISQTPDREWPRIVSALNGRVGSDILIPPYQRLVETEYVPPASPHWTDECHPLEGEDSPEDFPAEKILQPRRLSLRVF
jgi:hypothetical protein